MDQQRRLTLTERPEIPWLSLVFGYGPMLPFAFGAILAWFTTGDLHDEVVVATTFWAGSILAFLAGVRRGLSFRTEGGPALAQIVTMFVLFVVALAALWLAAHDYFAISTLLLTGGFASLVVLDPIAARVGQVPLFFARLRPPQLSIAVASLALLFINTLVAS